MYYKVDKINQFIVIYGVCIREGVQIFLLGLLQCFGFIFILCLE